MRRGGWADGFVKEGYRLLLKRRARSFAVALVGCTALVDSIAIDARADPPWASRLLTLPQGEFGVDMGVGVGTNTPLKGDTATGPGMFVALHYGITRRIELTVRDGVMFGNDAIAARAEQYGHAYVADASATKAPGTFSSPEILGVGRIVDLGFFELGAEAAMSFPVEPHVHVAATLGAPVAFHLPPYVRIDTGFFVTATFTDVMSRNYMLPLMVWFQPAALPIWVGPISGLQIRDNGDPLQVSLGVGAGWAINDNIDLRGEIVVPQIANSPGTRFMGGGLAVQLRF